jgi:hypothetical protein
MDKEELIGEWGASAQATARPRLTEDQQQRIKADLWSLGITEDPFAMDPIKRLAWLSGSKALAMAVYAAIKHETRQSHEITQTFKEWCRELGLPHA